jgi:hypothetical protein
VTRPAPELGGEQASRGSRRSHPHIAVPHTREAQLAAGLFLRMESDGGAGSSVCGTVTPPAVSKLIASGDASLRSASGGPAGKSECGPASMMGR